MNIKPHEKLNDMLKTFRETASLSNLNVNAYSGKVMSLKIIFFFFDQETL